MTHLKRYGLLHALTLAAFAAFLVIGSQLGAQVVQGPVTPVTIGIAYPMLAISATGAANAQVTLTIPTPPPTFYNYICSLAFNASNNNTGAVITNAVTTATNFNSFALKFSVPSAASNNYDWGQPWGIANAGCPKSTSPGTATTFVSPGAATNFAFTWYATYYVAP